MSERKWGTQQQQALRDVGRWLKVPIVEGDRDTQFYRLGGIAGTGKTTLAEHLAQGVSGPVYFAAYTGKAASVLAKAVARSGFHDVSTLHKLMYVPSNRSRQKRRDLEDAKQELLKQKPVPARLLADIENAIKAEEEALARPFFDLNPESPLKDAALCIVDEYSMIDLIMGNDMRKFPCKWLCLGDPGQLPPVAGRPFFTGKPETFLTEIHRQAKNNPIIRMASAVRDGEFLRPGDYHDPTGECPSSSVIRMRDLGKDGLKELALAAEQILVGKNPTRKSINNRMRQLLERTSELPQTGDRLMCLRNNHEAGLLNGQMFTALDDARLDDGDLFLSVRGDDDGTEFWDVNSHIDYFKGLEPAGYDMPKANAFDYGYAMTVHKSQGSQWNNILLLHEWRGNNPVEWYYTGLTRAAQRVDVVLM